MIVSPSRASDQHATAWDVRDGAKSWTVYLSKSSGRWLIASVDGASRVDPNGRRGQRIIAAVRARAEIGEVP